MKKSGLLAMVLVAAGCGDVRSNDEDGFAAEDVATVVQAVASDPSAVNEYGGACPALERQWNFNHMRIFHAIPPSGDCDGAVYGPLVILLHGISYHYDEYDPILRHLARNGMIAVSIEWPAANTVEEVRDIMDGFLFDAWDKAPFIDPTRVGLIGHSRGAEHVAALAEDLADGPNPGGPTWTVRAIASLAPVAHAAIDGEVTEGYLLLHGSDDGDQFPARSFEHFEAAGPPNSQGDPTDNPAIVYKAMKLLENGNHFDFTGSAEQAQVAKGYLFAFFAAHLLFDTTWYEDYIRGNEESNGGWSGGAVWSQYSDGLKRRVIDRFDDGNLSPSSIGGSVTTSNVNTSVPDLAAIASSPHTTHVLAMLATSTAGYVEWTVPAGKRDASGFEFLSLRMGQLGGAAATDLTLQIRNGAGAWSPEVVTHSHDPIAQPVDLCTSGLGAPAICNDSDERFHMSTLRVPLASFGVHDDVQRVRIRFRGNSALKQFYLDNLEFSEWPFAP